MITEGSIKKALATAAKTSRAIELKDGGERGAGRLALVVRPFETRVSAEWYAFSYRGGRRRMAKIGSYPDVNLAGARKAFREAHAPIISAGGAPTGPWSRAAAGPREATVGALVDDYVKHLEGRASHDAATNFLTAAVAKLPGGRDRLASAITTDDVRGVLAEIHARGSVVAAASTRAYLHAAFQAAIKAENSYTTGGQARRWGIKFNPVTAIPVDPKAARTGNRHLSPEEWAAFYRWLAGRDDPAAKALMLSLLTGQRIVEILRLSAAQFDRHELLLTWDTTKNKRPHAVPVCHLAAALLGDLPAMGPLFPDGESYDATRRLVLAFLEANPGIEHFTGRDLRRTWKTLAGAAGLSKEIRDKLQNHAMADVSSRHYDRWDSMPEKRAAIATWCAYAARMLMPPPGGAR